MIIFLGKIFIINMTHVKVQYILDKKNTIHLIISSSGIRWSRSTPWCTCISCCITSCWSGRNNLTPRSLTMNCTRWKQQDISHCFCNRRRWDQRGMKFLSEKSKAACHPTAEHMPYF